MRRRNRWITGLLGTAIVLLALLWIMLGWVLPAVIQGQVADLFRKAGFTDAQFELQKATLWHTTLGNVAAGKVQWLKVGTVAIDYSPIDVLKGDISAIRVRDGRLVVSLDDLAASQRASGNSIDNAKIPVERIELQSCTLVFTRGGRQIELPLNGTLLRAPSGSSQLNIRAMLRQARISLAGVIEPDASNPTDVTGEAVGVELAALVDLLPPAIGSSIGSARGTIDFRGEHHRSAATQPSTSMNLEINDGLLIGKGSDEGEMRDIYCKVRIDSLRPLSIPAGQWLTIGAVKVAGQELSAARLVFDATGIDSFHIADAQISWAGGRFRAAPFTISLSSGKIQTDVTGEHVDLAQVLALATQGRATGTGRLSGHVPVTFDGSRFSFGNGSLNTEGPGTLKLGDAASSLSQVLDQTDPRFTQDAQMKQVKQQILAALTDFQYDTIHADVTRDGDDLLVSVQIKGQGRTASRQPFDITLNFRGLERSLNSYLDARSRVFNSAR